MSKMLTTKMKSRGVATTTQVAAIVTRNNVEAIKVQFLARAPPVRAHATMS